MIIQKAYYYNRIYFSWFPSLFWQKWSKSWVKIWRFYENVHIPVGIQFAIYLNNHDNLKSFVRKKCCSGGKLMIFAYIVTVL